MHTGRSPTRVFRDKHFLRAKSLSAKISQAKSVNLFHQHGDLSEEFNCAIFHHGDVARDWIHSPLHEWSPVSTAHPLARRWPVLRHWRWGGIGRCFVPSIHHSNLIKNLCDRYGFVKIYEHGNALLPLHHLLFLPHPEPAISSPSFLIAFCSSFEAQVIWLIRFPRSLTDRHPCASTDQWVKTHWVAAMSSSIAWCRQQT